MEPTNKANSSIGPALAVVIVLGAVAIAGIFLYKTMIKDIMVDTGAATIVPEGWYAQQAPSETRQGMDNDDLSTSTDIDAIAADLETDMSFDTSLVDDIDAELLDFDDLDELDLTL